ncbi:MAG: hypothetical protein HKM95_10185 [Inquilinus sp.]|nr:hypothetical protein [Inquilinus sp.]
MKSISTWLDTLRLKWRFGRSQAHTVRVPKWKRERARIHGFQLVEQPAARAIFFDVAGAEMAAAGFALDRDRRYIRTVSADIVHLLQLKAFKGMQYGLQCGVSLSFMPHTWKRRTEWHRTERSARLDLFRHRSEDHREHDPLSAQHTGVIDGLHGEIALREDMVAAWLNERERIFGFFDMVADIDGVISVAMQQSARTGGLKHWPPPKLVEAFCLARLGRSVQAESAFEDAVEVHGKIIEPVDRLRAAFKKVLERGGS